MTNGVAGSVGEGVGIIYVRLFKEVYWMICLECLFRNRPEAAVCQQCGKPLVTGCRFAIPSASGSEVIVVPLPPAGEIVVGREDAIAGIFPDLDTNGMEHSAGVSRQHVRLRRRSERWFVVPFETTNPTLVNRAPAAPGREVAIAAQGDVLALGGLIVSIFGN